MAPRSILIVGCGIAGPVLASLLLLSDNKPQITLLERAASVRAQGQNIDIRGAGVNIIRKLGIETAIRSNVTGEQGVEWVDSKFRTWARIGASDNAAAATSDIEILRGKLGQICYERSVTLSDEDKEQGGPGIEYIFGDYVEAIEEKEDVLVRLHKGGERHFNVVVAADGLTSKTRTLVWGDQGLHKLGAYSAFFSMPRGGLDTDWRRWFHAPDGRGCMIRPSHDQSLSTVSMMVRQHNKALDDVVGRDAVDGQKAVMDQQFRGTGWEMDRVLKEMHYADDFYYSEIAQVRLDTLSEGRVVLLGDAGYCASPISGMGTTLAFVGAYHLAGALQHEDLDVAFEQYEAQMRPLIEQAQKKAPNIIKILLPGPAWALWSLHIFAWVISTTRIVELLFKLFGPTAEAVRLPDYGIRSVQDGWRMTS